MPWDWWEYLLWNGTGGRFNPDEASKLRRSEGFQPSSIEECYQARVSVVCPTTDSRHEFHDQLWAVFEAQAWPEKELVVVETYSSRPSPFFTEKAKTDNRIVFASYRVQPGQDWSIGLKRNMCTYLASGTFIANFDDDDLYAPNYLKVMMRSMLEQKSEAITLSTYYVFDVRSGKFGWTDQRYSSESTRYGYGFSYVFLRGAALEKPYPDQNMGEDFGFFSALRKRVKSTIFGGDRHVALLVDEDGICCHTLHPKATSNVYAKRQVPLEEVEALGFAEMDILEDYVKRFPQTQGCSDYIGRVQQREMKVKIHSSVGDFTVTCLVGTPVEQVQELLHPQLQCGGSPHELHLHLSCPPCLQPKDSSGAPSPNKGASNGDLGEDAVVPTEPRLANAERVNPRRAELWATLPAERHEEPDVEVTVRDIRNHEVSVGVRVHGIERLAGVRRAVITQHGSRSEAGRRLAKELRLASRIVKPGMEDCSDGVYFRACDLSRWLLDKREFFAPGLQQLLDQVQFERGGGLPVIRLHLIGVEPRDGFLIVEVPLPGTAKELRAALGDRLPRDARLFPGHQLICSGPNAPDVLEEDVRLPPVITADRYSNPMLGSIFSTKEMAVEAQAKCIAALSQPEAQQLFDAWEAEAEGDFNKYRTKLMECLPEQVYSSVLEGYGLPLSRKGVMILSTSMGHFMRGNLEMTRTWLKAETLMRNLAGMKAAEACVAELVHTGHR